MIRKLLFIFFTICFSQQIEAQTYIIKSNMGGYNNYSLPPIYSGGAVNELIYEILGEDGKWLKPIKETGPYGEYLIFNQKPTEYHYYFIVYLDYTEQQSQENVYLWASNMSNCEKGRGVSTFIRDVNIPEFELISSEVIPKPNTKNNSFCDKISLVASGCTGPQKFYWEYSTNGVNFTSLNVTTSFNQSFDFVKANFPSLKNYNGNIFFRALIDWDPAFADENIYSNVVTYKINPCSPTISISSPNNTTCNYTNGEVIFTFSRPLDLNEKFLFSRNLLGTDNFVSSTSLSADVEKVTDYVYKWKNIPSGTYDFSYQTQFESNIPSEAVKNLTFTITRKQKLEFEVNITQPACNGDFGQLKITAKGGTPPYSYYMGNESFAERHEFTSPYIVPTQFVSGDYKITVVDTKGCVEK
nr:SprB repeat-containing protein [uncultured Flavobacterium sp.]